MSKIADKWLKTPGGGSTIQETPTGLINGANKDYVISQDPEAGSLKVFLDGKRIWVAYQPFEKEISYILHNSLSIGEHNLLINI